MDKKTLAFALLGFSFTAGILKSPAGQDSDKINWIESRLLKHKIRLGLRSEQVPELARHIDFLCKKYSFDPALILAVIHVESSFRSHIRSNKGATGLMQIMPDTAEALTQIPSDEIKEALTNPFLNTSIGISYLYSLRARFSHNRYLYLAAYNAGPTRISRLVRTKRLKPNQTLTYYNRIMAISKNY